MSDGQCGATSSELEAVRAIIRAKLAAGSAIKNPGFEATRSERLQWIVYKLMRPRPPLKPGGCSRKLAFTESEQTRIGVTAGMCEVDLIQNRAAEYAPAKGVLPELQVILSGAKGGTSAR